MQRNNTQEQYMDPQLSLSSYRKVKSTCGLFLVAVVLAVASLALVSCDSQEVLPAVNAALSTLMQNKGLSEQYVRDLKSTLDQTDPEYLTNMADYEEARSSYDRYLDSVRLCVQAPRVGGAIDIGDERAEESASNFLAEATRSLRPGLETRGIQFRKAIVIPRDLVSKLRSLSPKLRTDLVNEFEPQIRWKSWRDL